MLRQRHPTAATPATTPTPSIVPKADNNNKNATVPSRSRPIILIPYVEPGDLVVADIIFGALLGAVVLTVYVLTLYPTIPGGDSGELVAEACTLGHSHPPGYPLFTMLYHAAFRAWDVMVQQDSGIQEYLPASLATWTVAQQANLVTAVSGSLAAVFLFRFTQLLAWSSMRCSSPWGVRVSSLTAAALFAFSPLVWQYSVGSEVFALNNLLISILLVVTAHFARFPTNTNAGIGAFVCGLAMCNQHTAVLFEAPLILWVLWNKRSDVHKNPWLAVQWGVWFIIGLLPYMYLPWSSIFNKQHGSWGDSSTVPGFIHHLRRGDYGTFQLFSKGKKPGAAGPYDRAMMYFSDFATLQAPSRVLVGLVAFGLLLTRVGGIRAFTNKVCQLITSSPIEPSMYASNRQRHPGMASSRARGRAAATAKKSVIRDQINNVMEEHRSSVEAIMAKVENKAGYTKDIKPPMFDPPMEMGHYQPVSATKSLGMATVFAFTTYVIIFHLLSNIPLDEALLAGVQARFWMQPNMIVFAWVGVGLVGCSNMLGKGNLNAYYNKPVFTIRDPTAAPPPKLVPNKASKTKAKKGRSDNVPLPVPNNPVMMQDVYETTAKNTPRTISGFLFLSLICTALVALQIKRNWKQNDQSSNNYLESYGLALLTSLPPKSILLINYDQQWTTVRYLQRCMHVRPDIIAINLSMMSFKWFSSYHHTYPTLSFPGTHLRAELGKSMSIIRSMDTPFTFAQFLDSNLGNAECCAGGIYMGGNVPQNDRGYMANYETKFVGLLTRFYHKKKIVNGVGDNGSIGDNVNAVANKQQSSPTFNEWFSQASQAWGKINKLVTHVPDSKYGADTWEWTVNRDRYEKMAAYGSEVLFEGVDKSDHGLIVLASSILEACWQGDGDEYVTVATLKNLGLSYVKLVQSKKDVTVTELAGNDILKEAGIGQYRTVASVRAYEAWSKFLMMKGAHKDSGYAHIQKVVKVLKGAMKENL